MKKRKFLMPILGMTTIATLMPAITSCQNGGSTPTPVPVVRTIGVSLTKSYKVGKTLEKADVKVTYENKEVATTDWTLLDKDGKPIEEYTFTDETAVNFTVVYKNKKTNFEVKAEKGDFVYEKDNSYLCENRFIEPYANEISHNIQFELKAAVPTGEHLEATITDLAETADRKVVVEETINLADYTFGNVFYAPVRHKGGAIYWWSQISNFNIVIKCVKADGSITWTDSYNDMYIKFTAINAWAGYDYRGYTNDTSRMDNWHYVKNMWKKGTHQYTDEYCVPFPIELRETMNYENELRAVVYDSHVYSQNGTELTNVKFELQEVDGTTKNWCRQPWDATNQWFPYSYDVIYENPQQDWTDKRFKKCYDIFMAFKPDDGVLMKAHDYAIFNLAVYCRNKDSWEIKWVQNFAGCKMTFLNDEYND